jgi:hypothetical protein
MGGIASLVDSRPSKDEVDDATLSGEAKSALGSSRRSKNSVSILPAGDDIFAKSGGARC